MVVGEEKGGERAVGRVLGEELIDGVKEALGLIERNGALAAEIGLQIGHEERGGNSLPGDVADDETETIGAEVEEVVIVAADSARRAAVTRIIETADWRTKLWEKAALDFVGDFQFLDGAAFGFELGGGGTALGFESVRDLVEADERKRVAIDIAEASDDAAPDRGFHAQNWRIGRGFGGARIGIVLEALEARRGMKADTAFGPFLKFCDDVFGDEDDIGGAADEFVFGGLGFRDDEGEDRGAVGRGNGNEAFAGLEFGVVGEMEAELVDEKADAAVVVADKDVDALDAEVGGGLWGWCAGGHGEIIRRREGGRKRQRNDRIGWFLNP